MNELTLEELKDEIRRGARCILQVRHAERPKMDPDDPSFGDALALTPEGVRTARELGKALAEFREDVQFYASPLRRTVMTAELIAEGMEGSEKVKVKGEKVRGEIPTDDLLGNGSFYYDDPAQVLEVFKPGNFFKACFEYYETGEQRGFKNLYAATDALEKWLFERFEKKLFIVTTHDCYVAAFLAARGAVEKFSIDNWIRFLDAGAILVYPDGSRKYALVRTGLSKGICGVYLVKGDSLTVKAHAKINWTLEILGTRPDGYHELRSIVLPVALHDDVTVTSIRNARESLAVQCKEAQSLYAERPARLDITVEGCGDVPLEKNLVYIAAKKLAERTGLKNASAAFTVVKRIPVGAGLGGGSADAAAALRALDAFWHLNLPEEILLEVAAEVGSDVPALLMGVPVMMEGRGERVRRLTAAELAEVPARRDIVLYTPPVFSSTAAVYKEHRAEDNGKGRNDLQSAALRLYPEIAAALEKLRAEGLSDVAMSGSGSTVYGIRKA